MPKKSTKKIVIILLFLDIILICVFVFLFLSFKNLIAESINVEDHIKTELKKQESLSLMSDSLQNSKIFQQDLMSYVLPSDGAVDFIKVLEQLASTTKVKSDIKAVSNEEYQTSLTNLEFLNVKMDILGEWGNIRYFLTVLENYPLRIDIKSVSFTKFSDYVINKKKISEWAGSLEFNVLKVKDTSGN